MWIRAGDRTAGTGWVVDRERRWVVTARHVLADRDRVEVYFLDHSDGKPITARRHYLANREALLKRGRIAPAGVVVARESADLALLELDRLPTDVPVLSRAGGEPEAGSFCWSVGHRHDTDHLWCRTEGYVRQAGTLTEGYFWSGRRLGSASRVLLVQSPIEAGESGAAVLNKAGQVVGVVSAVSGRTPGLAIVIAGAEIENLLREGRKDPPTDPREHRTGQTTGDRLARATVWVQPRATAGRTAGVLVDRDRRLILTSAAAVTGESIVDVVAARADKTLVAEAAAYRDLLGLRLSGHCVQGVVLARDRDRDLALVELDRVPQGLAALSLGANPRMGDRVASVSHPVDEELLWLHAAGSVRTVGRVTLHRDTRDDGRPQVALYQLPHQGSASGGPVVNGQGELIGVLSARDGARQELAYAAVPEEIRTFLTSTRPLFQPDTAAEWHARARFLDRHGRGRAALEAHQEASRRSHTDPRLLAHLANALAEHGDRTESRQVIARAERSPDRPAEAEVRLAETLLLLGEHEAAGRFADSAIHKDPRLADALLVRASLRNGERARTDVEEALFLDPNLAAGYRLRAALIDPSEPDRLDRSLADLSRAVELSPYHLDSRIKRASLLEEKHEFRKAVADWTRLTDLAPMHSAMWFGLSRAQFRAGDRPAAARSLTTAIRVDPKSVPIALRTIAERAGELHADNPADPDRVVGWYHSALKCLQPFLPEAIRAGLAVGIEQAGRATGPEEQMKRLTDLVGTMAAERPAKK